MIVNHVPRRIFSEAHVDALAERIGEPVLSVRDLEEKEVPLGEVEVLLSLGRLRREQVEAMPRLRWVQSFSAGVNTYPHGTLKERGILLTNTSGIHAPQMSDQIMGMILGFSRALLPCIRHQHARHWKVDYPLEELAGKEMLILGAGEIGQLLAKKAKAFDMRITGIRRHPRPMDHFDRVLSLENMDPMLAEADYIVVLAPLTTNTRGMIGTAQFQRMKETAVLINMGRGPLVEEEALLEALRSKRIRGAGLDVFSKEPLPPEHPLWDMENIILTPHTGGFSPETEIRAVELIADNVLRFRRGDPLRNTVDLERGY